MDCGCVPDLLTRLTDGSEKAEKQFFESENVAFHCDDVHSLVKVLPCEWIYPVACIPNLKSLTESA